MVWLETISNPSCNVTDVQAIGEEVTRLCATKGVPRSEVVVVCDSTWTTPVLQRPLLQGADLVLHSLTKFVGGHSDVLAGLVVVGDSEAGSSLLPKLREVQVAAGAVCSPMDAWMALRGLRTLEVRMRRHCESTAAVATFLHEHPMVERVLYPGHPSDPQHALASSLYPTGCGGLLSLLVKPRGDGDGDGEDEALEVVRRMRLIKRATSLGGVESLIEHRRSAEGQYPFSPPNLLRLSVGLEDVVDITRDLDQALTQTHT